MLTIMAMSPILAAQQRQGAAIYGSQKDRYESIETGNRASREDGVQQPADRRGSGRVPLA